VCSCVLKEAWLWRCSEGRVGSHAFKANLLLLASLKLLTIHLTYSIVLSVF